MVDREEVTKNHLTEAAGGGVLNTKCTQWVWMVSLSCTQGGCKIYQSISFGILIT